MGGNILSFPAIPGRTIATIDVVRTPDGRIVGRLVDMSAAEIEAEATIPDRFRKVVGWLRPLADSLEEQAQSFEEGRS